jgi:hypothetical protein
LQTFILRYHDKFPGLKNKLLYYIAMNSQVLQTFILHYQYEFLGLTNVCLTLSLYIPRSSSSAAVAAFAAATAGSVNSQDQQPAQGRLQQVSMATNSQQTTQQKQTSPRFSGKKRQIDLSII